MVDTAGRAAGPGNRTRVSLQLLDELADVLDFGIGRNDDSLVFAGEARDRRDIGKRHGRLVGQDGADHDVATDDQSIRIALLLAGKLGKTDCAASAWNVHDLNIAGNAFRLHHLLQRTGGLVPAAAGRCGSHDRVICSHGRKSQSACEKRSQEKVFQDSPPPSMRLLPPSTYLWGEDRTHVLRLRPRQAKACSSHVPSVPPPRDDESIRLIN